MGPRPGGADLTQAVCAADEGHVPRGDLPCLAHWRVGVLTLGMPPCGEPALPVVLVLPSDLGPHPEARGVVLTFAPSLTGHGWHSVILGHQGSPGWGSGPHSLFPAVPWVFPLWLGTAQGQPPNSVIYCGYSCIGKDVGQDPWWQVAWGFLGHHPVDGEGLPRATCMGCSPWLGGGMGTEEQVAKVHMEVTGQAETECPVRMWRGLGAGVGRAKV